uniref:Uncharacterized protein n=1 Tax=viral metagenome TaxID=1070528 RepID=A0A6M3L8H6_9ZZZZ
MTQDGIISRSEQAVSSGLTAILEIEGNLEPLKRVPGKRFDTDAEDKVVKDQIELKLTDAIIREMEGSQPEPELKDDEWRTWYTYAPPGHNEPSKQSKFTRVFTKSAEKLWADRKEPDKGWRDLVGTRVVLRKTPLKYKIEGETIETFAYGFIEGDDQPQDLDSHVAGLIEGKDKATALRAIMMDSKAKRDPAYKEAVKLGRDVAGCSLVEGVYKKQEA